MSRGARHGVATPQLMACAVSDAPVVSGSTYTFTISAAKAPQQDGSWIDIAGLPVVSPRVLAIGAVAIGLRYITAARVRVKSPWEGDWVAFDDIVETGTTTYATAATGSMRLDPVDLTADIETIEVEITYNAAVTAAAVGLMVCTDVARTDAWYAPDDYGQDSANYASSGPSSIVVGAVGNTSRSGPSMLAAIVYVTTVTGYEARFMFDPPVPYDLHLPVSLGTRKGIFAFNNITPFVGWGEWVNVNIQVSGPASLTYHAWAATQFTGG